MFTPTVVYPRETQNVTVIDDADMSWPVLPGDFPAVDAEVVPYMDKAFQGEVYHQTLTAITLPLNLSYAFTGTPRVVLNGVAFPRLNPKVATATYFLDDRLPVTLELPRVLEATNIVFFSADDLPNGSHTLTVQVDAGPSYPYVVDYLEYQSFVGDSAISSPSSAASSPSSTPSSTTSAILPSSTQPSTATPSGTGAPPAGTSGHNIGPIVGGAIGGLALLCIMVLAVVWYLLRRRAEESTRKSSIFSADSMVQPRSASPPPPVQADVPVQFHHYRIEKASSASRPPTVMTAPSDSDVKSSTHPSSATISPVSERPPTIRLEPPSTIASISYLGDRYIRSSRRASELIGSPPAYSL
ncbi:hypothetical protein K466DRAFT_595492 [Polyporus arcularius HHB13444]|uniref:Uncharacterized protein n=1 Tax=Polyporus arcularius HHB13444 TaxID=1314778 RepID=A0A5C3PWB4_9APHY|nr:hypothetical protein K466DRAFT_595492 [Polyporus arcularius HHB13444]